MAKERATVFYNGQVQGIGFRYTTRKTAFGFEVAGTVRNLDDGRVEMIVEGEKPEVEAFLEAIKDSEVGRFIKGQTCAWSEAKHEFRGFEIIR
jgi:acylphosphatase